MEVAGDDGELGSFEGVFQFDEFLREELEKDLQDELRQEGAARARSGQERGISGRAWQSEENAYANSDADVGEAGSSSSSSSTLYVTSTSMNTIGDAMQLLSKRFESQVEKAASASAPPNVPVRGDFEARKSFLTLLPSDFQRVFFLRFASQQRNWPRLRPLFGAPPYSFLKAQDASILNSTGIARTRTNMAYDDSKIVNYSQFGLSQWVDEYEREYRVVSMALREHDELPSNLSQSLSSNKLYFVCRVLKRSKQEKIKRLKETSLRKTVLFPVSGERVNLRESKPMMRIHGKTGSGLDRREVSLRILDVRPRDANASTAAVVAMRT